jgi:hypothetical protein
MAHSPSLRLQNFSTLADRHAEITDGQLSRLNLLLSAIRSVRFLGSLPPEVREQLTQPLPMPSLALLVDPKPGAIAIAL